MANKDAKKTTTVKKSHTVSSDVVNEQKAERLDMAEINAKWSDMASKLKQIEDKTGSSSQTILQWNRLNPFLQNQRVKLLNTQNKVFDKNELGKFLQNPANHESEIRGVGWTQSSYQQIYYNVLRHSCDIPQYKYYKIPEYYDDINYSKPEFQSEDIMLERWLELFNIPNTFKTIALQVKREGKSSYLFRNKIEGKDPIFTTLQKMPTEWVKITGISQQGYTISFNMMYFLNIANDPARFGDFIEAAWKNMVDSGVVTKNNISQATRGANKLFAKKQKTFIESDNFQLDLDKAKNYQFEYQGRTYNSMIEGIGTGKQDNYLFWLQMPADICFTFSSDNSHPWVAPDTMGLLMKLQELQDYQTLAGLIASTPLTAVLTGEIEPIANARGGKNESVFSPEVIDGYVQQFNAVTSTNIEAWLLPGKNIKLQQLNSDVNSSEIIKTATENFISSAGEGGLTAITDKPNIGQVTVAKQLAAEQQRYVTLQFENVMNFIINNKLGLKYRWKLRIWGDVFNIDNDRKFLKELVAGGATMFLPKLLSAEDISVLDTKAITSYIKTLDFYKDLSTFSMEKQAELSIETTKETAKITQKTNPTTSKIKTVKAETGNKKSVGKPAMADGDVQNDSTAASKAAGTNTTDNRNQVK